MRTCHRMRVVGPSGHCYYITILIIKSAVCVCVCVVFWELILMQYECVKKRFSPAKETLWPTGQLNNELKLTIKLLGGDCSYC